MATSRSAAVERSALSSRSTISPRIDDCNLSLFFNSTSFTVPVVPSTSGFSVAFWFWRKSNGNGEILVDCTDSSNFNGFNVFQGNSGSSRLIQFRVSNAAASPALIATTTLANYRWYHIACTFTTNSAKIYLDGVLQATDTSCDMTTPANTMTVGKRSSSSLNTFNSYIDNFVFKNGTPWTQQEITDLYSKGTIPASTNVHYDFNSTFYETTLTDLTGNGNHGTLTIGNGAFTDFVRQKPRRDGFSMYPDGSYDVFIIGGQSNAGGRGVSNQSYTHPSLYAAMLGNDYVYKELTDPTDSTTNQVDSVSLDVSSAPGGSVWPLLATLIMRRTGRPVLFVPCAMTNTTILQWQPGGNTQDRTTLFGSMVYRTLQAQSKGTLKGILWLQGETDAINGTGQSTYKSRLDTVASTIKSVLNIPFVVGKIHNGNTTDANEAVINAAIDDAWTTNANVTPGPNLYTISTPSNVHLTTNSELYSAATLWYNSLVAASII